MVVNILEDITTALASKVISDVSTSYDKQIDVNIMSRGGDMVAGNAIITALQMSPAKVTTRVYGIAASMAAAISQAGDNRLISDDAIFQVHYGAGIPNARPTSDNLKKTAAELDMLNGIMIKSFDKSNLDSAKLESLLKEDKPLSATEAISMNFFDGSFEPVKAEAYLTSQKMKSEQTLLEKLSAFKDSILKAEEHEPVLDAPAAPASPDGAETVEVPAVEAPVTRAEFDKLLLLVEELVKGISPLPQKTVTEEVAAIVKTELAAIISDSVAPVASQTGDSKEPEVASETGFLEARQKEIQSKFKK